MRLVNERRLYHLNFNYSSDRAGLSGVPDVKRPQRGAVNSGHYYQVVFSGQPEVTPVYGTDACTRTHASYV